LKEENHEENVPCSSRIICAAAPTQAQNVSDREANEIARDAYVYAYSLMLMDVSFRQFTNYAEPTGVVTQGV
jgi:hypothetical protein